MRLIILKFCCSLKMHSLSVFCLRRRGKGTSEMKWLGNMQLYGGQLGVAGQHVLHRLLWVPLGLV